MSAHGTKGSGMTWVGRAIRRLEDPALVTGQGRFTADLPAAHWVRFVRSPVAAGNDRKINAPKGALVITAADLKGVKKITPMLHKFNYKPVGQPILADGVVRFVGEPVAAVVAPARKQPKTSPNRSNCRSTKQRPWSMRVWRLRRTRRRSTPKRRAIVILEGKIKTPDFDAVWKNAAQDRSRSTRARAARTRRRWKRAPAMPPTTYRPAA